MAEETKQPAEKQTNCPSCNKPIKKKSKYYRNGKYYCMKRCYLKVVAKSKQKETQDENK